jgi:hypothetical protein
MIRARFRETLKLGTARGSVRIDVSVSVGLFLSSQCGLPPVSLPCDPWQAQCRFNSLLTEIQLRRFHEAHRL